MSKDMKTIHIAPGVAPFQLEGFPKDAQRSAKGALHFCGGQTKNITDDELATLMKKRKDLVLKVTVSPITPKAKKPVAKKPAAKPAPSEGDNDVDKGKDKGKAKGKGK